jgi:hypothetical protein
MKGAVKMTEINGKDLRTAEPSIGVEEDRLWRDLRIKITEGMKLPHDDKEYEKLCCEQCNRLWAAYAGKRKKSATHPYCGACMSYLPEDVLRILSRLEAPCRYCGDVPWVDHDVHRGGTGKGTEEICGGKGGGTRIISRG